MFEVGEKIECIKNNNNVTIGSTYKVVDVSTSVVGIINDAGSKSWYYTHVFKKCSDVVNPEEYVELDPKIYSKHKLRKGIDEVLDLKHGYTNWQIVDGSGGCSIESYVGTSSRKIRCKRKYLPVLSAPAEAVAKPVIPDEVTSPKCIPFDGAGRYRLKNGQIVNLDERRICLKSDKIVSNHGNIADWTWNSDGSVTPEYLFNEELYLAEKLVPESIDKVAKQLKSFGFTMADDIPPKGIKCGTTDFVGGSVELDRMAYPVKDVENVKSLLANNAGRGMMDLVWGPELDFKSVVGSTDISEPTAHVLKGNNVKRETVVKIASATGKFLLSTAFKAVNYWVVGPAITLGRPVVNSVRYATFLASLVAVGYACYHPTAATAAKDAVADVFWSCMPTISIEEPAILRDATDASDASHLTK